MAAFPSLFGVLAAGFASIITANPPTPDTPMHSSSTEPADTSSATLNAWLAQESSVRERLNQGPGYGVARMDQVMGKTGMEIFEAMLNGQIPAAPIAHTLDFMLVEARPGVVIFQGTPGPTLLNPLGTVHGGWYATLLDSALGCAVHTLLPAGRTYTTAELSVNIVRSVGLKVPRVRAEGKVIHCGRQLATAEARLVGPDGTLYAHATTTCLVFDIPSPRP